MIMAYNIQSDQLAKDEKKSFVSVLSLGLSVIQWDNPESPYKLEDRKAFINVCTVIIVISIVFSFCYMVWMRHKLKK